MPATSSAIELKGGTVKESKGAEKKEGSSLGLLSSSPSSVPSWFSKGGPGKAGCLSTLVWWWVNPLVDHASRHPISKSMLWPLAESHTSDDLLARFDEEWKRQIESGNPSLASAFWTMFRSVWVMTGLGWLLSNVLMFAFPLLIRAILLWYEDDDSPVWRGYLLVGILFGISFIQSALVLGHVVNALYVVGMDLRTLCNALVYRKSLKLSTSARQRLGTGQIVTLMSADAENFPRTTLFLHALWVNPLFIALALYFLVSLIGVASLVGIAVILVSFPLQAKLGMAQMVLQKKLLQSTDHRVRLIAEALDSIKVLKFYAWEESLQKRVRGLRDAEVKNVLDFAYVNAANLGLAVAIPIVMILLTLVTYYETGGSLDPDIVFTAVSLLVLIRFPILSIPLAVGSFVRGKVSLKRLESFILEPEITWDGITWKKACSVDDADDSAVIKKREGGAAAGSVGEVTITKASFRWPVAEEEEAKDDSKSKKDDKGDKEEEEGSGGKKQEEVKRAMDTEEVKIDIKEDDDERREKQQGGGKGPDTPISSSSSSSADSFTLHNLSLGAETGRLVGIVGNVGAGKSSLLQAILGEMPMVSSADEKSAASAAAAAAAAASAAEIRGGSLASQLNYRGGSVMSVDGATTAEERGSTSALVGKGKQEDGLEPKEATSGPKRQPPSTLGNVSIQGSVAYCAQTAWIVNATLRENILFNKPMVTKWYNEVIDACALRQDIEQLPAGEETEIGEKGINLSGGQRQRVALARAVYSNADVYLLDDVLSAVDAHVGSHIFQRVVCGLLRGKKVLLATNALKFLSSCDSLVVLKGGRISEKGTYAGLIASGGDFAALMKEFDQENKVSAKEGGEDDEKKEESEGGHVEEKKKATAVGQPERVSEAKKERGTDESAAVKEKMLSDPSKKKMAGGLGAEVKGGQSNVVGKELTTKETMKSGAVSLSTFKYMFVTGIGGWGVAILLVVIVVTAQVAQNCFEWWLAVWSEAFLDGGGSTADYYVIVYAVLGVGAVAFAFLRAGAFAKALAVSSQTMHGSLVESVMRAPMSFFDTTPSGRIMNRFSKDIDQIDTSLHRTVPQFASMLLGVIGVTITIILLVPLFIIAVLPLCVAYYMVQRYFRPVARGLQRLENVSRSPIFSRFSESLMGVVTIRAFGQDEQLVERVQSLIDESNRPFYLIHNCNRWLQLRLEALGAIIILAIGVVIVSGRDSSLIAMNAGLAGLLLTYAQQITQRINWAIRTGVETEARMTSVERIREYSLIQPEAERVNKGYAKPSGWPSKGGIEFRNVSMRYRPGLKLVLRDVNLKIPAGAKVGIVGRTGSGKSSLMTVLFRLVEPEVGSTLIVDGVDCLKLGLKELRSAMAIIPQDPVMFYGTIRYNLDPFGDHSDEDVWAALRCAELQAVVNSQEKQLDTMVEEGGGNFSLGQRQLICLARALLRRPKILIMDEATASIDFQTDSLIQKAIRTEFKDCTVLTIAHRIETIIDSDMIVVMDNGKVAEFDTPSDLLSKPQSLFSALVAELKTKK